jgi:hypothetical protein
MSNLTFHSICILDEAYDLNMELVDFLHRLLEEGCELTWKHFSFKIVAISYAETGKLLHRFLSTVTN